MEDKLQRIYNSINRCMRWLTFIFLIAAIIGIALFKTNGRIADWFFIKQGSNPQVEKANNEAALLRLRIVTKGLKSYAEKNSFNSRYCFLIDMKLPSGNKRFYIYDLQNNSILQSGLVAHGSGVRNFSGSIAFSNEVGSNCTSLGKYKTGKGYYGKFGLAYKLYGLDKTNCNAYSRFVVLHSHSCVPEKAITPFTICESLGCPTVSPGFLNSLKPIIEKSKQPLLLWIFN